ncbi:MAG: Gfo/Idh/MocA family oxidoreductase [Spirochaetaceae bacterium]|nr:Gfo/Idh/MocA family oxidoreductase [Spirochaetaceae bacterium]
MTNWGIMGPGAIAHSFAKGLSIIDNAKIYAVASHSKERAQSFANEFNAIKVYDSYEDLCKDPKVDVVYISTINPLHEECIEVAIKNHKNILCEKPLTLDPKITEKLLKKARVEGVFIMEAFWTKFLPSFIKAKELLSKGTIGDLKYIESSFCFYANPKHCVRHLDKKLGGGVIYDVGIYGIESACDIFETSPVSINHSTSLGKTGVDTNSTVILDFGQGRSANMHFSFEFDKPQDMYIYGSKGYMKLPSFWNGTSVELYSNNELKHIYKLPFNSSGYEYEAREVMNNIEKGKLESSRMKHIRSVNISKIIKEIMIINVK